MHVILFWAIEMAQVVFEDIYRHRVPYCNKRIGPVIVKNDLDWKQTGSKPELFGGKEKMLKKHK